MQSAMIRGLPRANAATGASAGWQIQVALSNVSSRCGSSASRHLAATELMPRLVRRKGLAHAETAGWQAGVIFD